MTLLSKVTTWALGGSALFNTGLAETPKVEIEHSHRDVIHELRHLESGVVVTDAQVLAVKKIQRFDPDSKSNISIIGKIVF